MSFVSIVTAAAALYLLPSFAVLEEDPAVEVSRGKQASAANSNASFGQPLAKAEKPSNTSKPADRKPAVTTARTAPSLPTPPRLPGVTEIELPESELPRLGISRNADGTISVAVANDVVEVDKSRKVLVVQLGADEPGASMSWVPRTDRLPRAAFIADVSGKLSLGALVSGTISEQVSTVISSGKIKVQSMDDEGAEHEIYITDSDGGVDGIQADTVQNTFRVYNKTVENGKKTTTTIMNTRSVVMVKADSATAAISMNISQDSIQQWLKTLNVDIEGLAEAEGAMAIHMMSLDAEADLGDVDSRALALRMESFAERERALDSNAVQLLRKKLRLETNPRMPSLANGLEVDSTVLVRLLDRDRRMIDSLSAVELGDMLKMRDIALLDSRLNVDSLIATLPDIKSLRDDKLMASFDALTLRHSDSLLRSRLNLMVPIKVRSGKGEKGVDYLLWYEANEELFSALPGELAEKLRAEVKLAGTYESACDLPAEAPAGERLLDVWKTCNGAIRSTAVAPNPATSDATVSFTLNEERTVAVALHNLSGAVIKEIAPSAMLTPGTHSVPFSVAGLTPGMYLVVISTPQGEQALQRLVVRQ